MHGTGDKLEEIWAPRVSRALVYLLWTFMRQRIQILFFPSIVILVSFTCSQNFQVTRPKATWSAFKTQGV